MGLKKLLFLILILFVTTPVFAADVAINDQTAMTTGADGDILAVYDLDATAGRGLTFANFWTNYLKTKADALYEGILTNEAGLYAALSDVSDFVQPSEVDVEMLSDVTGEGTAATYPLFDDNDGTYSFRAIADGDIPTILTLETISGTPVITNGARIGTDDTDHLIDEASNGAGSATLYIGNESILASGDIGVSVQAYNANTTVLGSTIGASEVDADIATQAELDAVAALVDTDDELIAIINASPSTQIGVPAGGTGAGTFTDGGLLVGAGTGAFEALAVGLTTQVLVGGGAGTNPVWGTDLPTAVTIGSGYIYRAGGTDVPDADVADDITLTNITQITNRAITSLSATNWRIFYSAGGSVPVELALGADGTYLRSNGASAAPTFDTPAGSGDMLKATYDTGDNSKVDDADVVTVSDSGDADATWYLIIADGATGTQTMQTDSGLSFNPSTNILTVAGGVVVTPNATAAQYTDYYEDTDDGSNYHRLQGQAFSANRTTLLPDYNAGFLASGQVDSSGDLADGAVDPVHLADGDFGDFSVSSGSATLDADVVAAAEMADADHGDVSWSGGVATVEAVSGANAVDSGAYVDGSIDPEHIAASAAWDLPIEAGADAQADDNYSGIKLHGRNAGEAITQWDAVFFNSADSEWHQADADAAGEWPARGIAVAAGTDGNELVVMVQGVVRNDGWTWGTVGGPIYLADTAGGLTQTAPSTSGDCVQIVGWALSDDEAYFNFSGHYLEVE